jgi:predicted dehydrogenase
MIDALIAISHDCELKIPDDHKIPLAVVGAGSIVERAHLPTYARLGLEVLGILDVRMARAEQLSSAFQIGRVYRTLDELLADKRIAIVDVALPPAAQPDVIEKVLLSGRHVLAQKPMTLDSHRAAELAETARRHRVHLVANQQARYDEGVMAARSMMRRGWIGTPVGFEMSVLRSSPWRGWYNDVAQLELWYHSIHELDVIRSWFGTPARVWCGGGKVPQQHAAGETNVVCAMTFSDHLHGVYRATSEVRGGDGVARFRIDGTAGTIEGDFGRFSSSSSSPHGRPDRLRVWSRSLPTDGWLEYPCTTRWFLDAFAGPIGSLLRAIATGTDVSPDASDNVDTLRLVEALYDSMATGESRMPNSPI